MKPLVFLLTPGDLPLGSRAARAIDGEVALFARDGAAPGGIAIATDPAGYLRNCFASRRPIVAVMAAGALIRILAPLIADKENEPPVLVLAVDGSSIVPLLGGHRGANSLARSLARKIGCHAAITTAGDLKFDVALDEPPPGHRLANPQNAKPVMAALARGQAVRLEGGARWLQDSELPFADDGAVSLRVTDKASDGAPLELVYNPATLVLGMGCERGTQPREAVDLARAVLRNSGHAELSVACIASIDLKADEPAIHAVAEHFGVPARFFDAAALETQYERLPNPSDRVFAEVGCHGVAEGAALLATGPQGELVVAKTKSDRATCALARAPAPLVELPGRARGILNIVGIGPGGSHWCSPEATSMIESASDLVGYSLYLDLVGSAAAAKRRHDFALGEEEKRALFACELASEGKNVALICSGDAGIYAMATLVFEMLDRGELGDAAKRIEVAVAPGISAFQAAAARVGAPIGHDFCAISLSDLLTPWETIAARVEAAAAADFVIAFYNPVSRRRRMQLAFARETLLRHRHADTPVILGSNLGRKGENLRILTLEELRVEDVDMLTVVLVGSSQSRAFARGDGSMCVYTPRGYDKKRNSRIAQAPFAQGVP